MRRLTAPYHRSGNTWRSTRNATMPSKSAPRTEQASSTIPSPSDHQGGARIMDKLQAKVAVITGGTSGIGLATAKLFVEEGAYVFITGRRRQELDEAVKSIGSNVTAVQGDVTKLGEIDRLYEV